MEAVLLISIIDSLVMEDSQLVAPGCHGGEAWCPVVAGLLMFEPG